FAILAALWKREETGKGQYIDLSQWETLVSILPEGIMPYTMGVGQPPRMGNRDIHMAPHGIFRSLGDDRWASIVVRDDAEWQRCAPLLGAGVASDPRFAPAASRKANEDALEELVTAWTSARDEWAITDQLQALGIAATPVFDMRDIAEDPHMNERGFF